MATAAIVIGLALGFVSGTFGEYWIHRGMHRGLILAEVHASHHRDGTGQGAFGEFLGYSVGTLFAAFLCLPIDYYWISGGVLAAGVISGVMMHAVFAGWCHQAQHEDPRLMFWLSKTPTHFVHHRLNQTRHNFGISVDWWDHVFGTYKLESNWRSLTDPKEPRAWWQLFSEPPRA
jgi:sterol desaturase/sphingolipid hydroxylase (fatty acid hydroxylase superfamily)